GLPVVRSLPTLTSWCPMAPITWPETDHAAELLRRLRADDPLAPSDFAAAFLDPLVTDLCAANPRVDEHALVTAAEDAVLSVIRNPAGYDPVRCDRPAFLRMAARGDLKNAESKEQRHYRNRDDGNPVELAADDRNSSAEGEDELPSFDDPRLAAVIAAMTD